MEPIESCALSMWTVGFDVQELALSGHLPHVHDDGLVDQGAQHIIDFFANRVHTERRPFLYGHFKPVLVEMDCPEHPVQRLQWDLRRLVPSLCLPDDAPELVADIRAETDRPGITGSSNVQSLAHSPIGRQIARQLQECTSVVTIRNNVGKTLFRILDSDSENLQEAVRSFSRRRQRRLQQVGLILFLNGDGELIATRCRLEQPWTTAVLDVFAWRTPSAMLKTTQELGCSMEE